MVERIIKYGRAEARAVAAASPPPYYSVMAQSDRPGVSQLSAKGDPRLLKMVE